MKYDHQKLERLHAQVQADIAAIRNMVRAVDSASAAVDRCRHSLNQFATTSAPVVHMNRALDGSWQKGVGYGENDKAAVEQTLRDSEEQLLFLQQELNSLQIAVVPRQQLLYRCKDFLRANNLPLPITLEM